jgi:hypothetical protein
MSMLQPIMSVFNCSDDLLKDVIKFFFMFGRNKLKISSDFLMKNLGDLMEEKDKSLLGTKTVLEQPFDVFFKYLNGFLDELDNIPAAVGMHIEFNYNRKVVWNFLQFVVSQDDNFNIKKTVVTNHLKNTEIYYDSERFVRFVSVAIEELSKDEHPFNVLMVENVLFIISKIISIFNFVKVNNAVVASVNKVITSNDVVFDTAALNEVQSVIDGMSNTSISSSVDELVLDAENFNLEIENLNYPIIPVSVFQDLRFFQEKRVFIFVGASGVGKSMILCHIASDMWLNESYKKAPNETIFYFTMENLKEEITARIVANAFFSHCKINKTIDDVVAGNFTTNEKNVLWQKMKNVKRTLCINYLPPKVYGTIMLRNIIKKRMYERGEVPYAIVVDYLDLLRSENKRIKDEHQELGEVVNELKALGSELSVPVITVSHLNADGCRLVKDDMGSLGGRQMGKSLRKYENADVVCFVDEEQTGGLGYNVMNFFVSKHRYARKMASTASSIFGRKYLPEYSFLGMQDQDLSENLESSEIVIDSPKDLVEELDLFGGQFGL